MKTFIDKLKKSIATVSVFIIGIISLTLFCACDTNEFVGITAQDVTVVYDQTGHNIIVNGIENYPDAKVEYSSEKANAGTYTQTVKISQKGYKDFSVSATLTITKATPTIGVNDKNRMPVYDGEEKSLTFLTNYEQRDSAVVEYYQDDTLLTELPKEIGEYKAKVILTESTNYFAYSETFDFIIRKPQYSASFVIINPLTQEQLEAVYLPFYRDEAVDVSGVVIPEYEGFTFEGWFVDGEPLSDTYTYGKNVEVIGRYVSDAR